MSWPNVYLLFPGNAREALQFYADIFGGRLTVYSYAEFGRDDGPPDAISHGMLTGAVELFGADAGSGERSVELEGMMLSLLGTDAELLRGWFDQLSRTGRVLSPLQQRPWGAWDGQVVDRYGVRWLIGFEA